MDKRTLRLLDKMTDVALIRATLRKLDVAYVEKGSTFALEAPFAGVVIDVSTGLVTAPEGSGRSASSLRQRYAEAKFRAEAERLGVEITEATTNRDGDIVMRCRSPRAHERG